MAKAIQIDATVPPSITEGLLLVCMSARPLVSVVIFSFEARFTCLCLSVCDYYKGQEVAFKITDQTATTPPACFFWTVGPGQSGCTLTGGRAVRSPRCHHQQLCTWRRSSCDCCPPRCQSSAVSRPPSEAVVFSPKSWEQMSGHKTSPYIKSPQIQLIMNLSASLGFMLHHLFSSDLCLLPFFSGHPSQSFISQGVLSWLGQMSLSHSAVRLDDVSPGLCLQSGHVLFCYNNISTALPCLIYSLDLVQGADRPFTSKPLKGAASFEQPCSFHDSVIIVAPFIVTILMLLVKGFFFLSLVKSIGDFVLF